MKIIILKKEWKNAERVEEKDSFGNATFEI